MPVVLGCLVPHPPIIIPEIGRDNLQQVAATVKAMKNISIDVSGSRPDTLLFVSPHTAGFSDAIAVKTDPLLTGDFGAFGAPSVTFSVENDLNFAGELLRAAEDHGLNLAEAGRKGIDFTGASILDHGIMVPLYYLIKEISVPIVSIAIDYRGYDEHFALGKAIARATDATGKRVAFIASGDLSHRLIPGAPSGYDPRGTEFDAKLEAIFRSGNFDKLKSLDPRLIEAAGECGLRSIYALAGSFDGVTIDTKVFSHEGPFGVGYMVAGVYPVENRSIDSLSKQSNTGNSDFVESSIPSAPVELAMFSLANYFALGRPVDPPEDTPGDLLSRRAGTFVCLKIDGNLRGCIGTIQPTYGNIAEEIMANAIQAATADPRFFPVTEQELPYLTCTVDILGEPEPVDSMKLLDPKTYGVIVRQGYRTGLLLPDIDGVDTVDDQIAIAKKKAGIDLSENTELYRFKVIRYE
jgi:AmmeMemoRadiSam system protein A